MKDRPVREFIPVNTISDQLYQDQDAIRRSLSVPFNVETERVERKTGWEGGRVRDGEGDTKRERERGTNEGTCRSRQ